jgi:hypothetical protein
MISGITQWAIVTLIPATILNLEMLSRRNELLVYYLKKFPPKNERNISIIMFSEYTFENKTYDAWTNQFRDIAPVQLIDTSSDGFHRRERFGYRYMCKFFMLDIYKYLDAYDYYWRLDNDCFVIKLNYDIFSWVEKNGIQYAYPVQGREEHKTTAETLPYWLSNYTAACDVKPTAPLDNNISVPMHFYNNFHIGYVRFFKRPDVQHFLLSINSTGFLTTHRWGDAPLQAYAVRLFMDPQAIRQIQGFEYVHGSHRNRITNTSIVYVRGIITQMIKTNISDLVKY